MPVNSVYKLAEHFKHPCYARRCSLYGKILYVQNMSDCPRGTRLKSDKCLFKHAHNIKLEDRCACLPSFMSVRSFGCQ